jgi:hypothetical protein
MALQHLATQKNGAFPALTVTVAISSLIARRNSAS